MAHSVLTPMLLELLRLAASDGDVSAWGRTQQGEDSQTDRQHLLTRLSVRGSWRKQAAAAWLCGRGQSERCVSSQCLSNCILGALKLPLIKVRPLIPLLLAAAMPSDKAEAHLQESQGRAKIPRGFADTLACSSGAREKCRVKAEVLQLRLSS